MGKRFGAIVLGGFFLVLLLGSVGLGQAEDLMIDIDNHVATFSGTWGTNSSPILFYGDDFRWFLWG